MHIPGQTANELSCRMVTSDVVLPVDSWVYIELEDISSCFLPAQQNKTRHNKTEIIGLILADLSGRF